MNLLSYSGCYTPSSPPLDLPILPNFNDTSAALNFTFSIRSLNSELHPCAVPKEINERIVSTVSVNTFPCPPSQTCQGPNGSRLAASMNNISFAPPSIDILEAYFYHIPNVFGDQFKSFPPVMFNYTANVIPIGLQTPIRGTQVKLVRYGCNMEIVLQGTNLVAGIDHPMHLHGFTFFIVGWGLGNFDVARDPLNYNLDDPEQRNTVIVLRNGWAAIRFNADNPGVWFMHCHFERHQTWGMETVFIVRSGSGKTERVLPPPHDMPPC
ncbi:hypothetical protein CASFOL_017193 [Castilleja foliolosa]|uniref:Plastocyanin-like domain-containing protein n=1 Tax=Castilleja foliolosa TaxID=1961234 RepID=A0ABD3DCG7_9LAMI